MCCSTVEIRGCKWVLYILHCFSIDLSVQILYIPDINYFQDWSLFGWPIDRWMTVDWWIEQLFGTYIHRRENFNEPVSLILGLWIYQNSHDDREIYAQSHWKEVGNSLERYERYVSQESEVDLSEHKPQRQRNNPEIPHDPLSPHFFIHWYLYLFHTSTILTERPWTKEL